MRKIIVLFIAIFTVGLASSFYNKEPINQIEESLFVSYVVDPGEQELHFFWKDKKGKNYVDFQRLKDDLEGDGKELIFAMNGGMYNKDLTPQGLYIENEKVLGKVNRTQKGYGNFYLQPNGIFYLTKDNKGVVCQSSEFENNGNVKYATQSGPMLVVDGKIHSKFTKGSKNVHIRNGVGVLPNGDLIFAMSKDLINFHDFATYFKQKNCKNALYLDGFVSKTYLPSKNWEQLKGKFGVIIGAIKDE